MVERSADLENRLDSLRSWITRNASLKSSTLILMTARGKQVKLQTLLTEKEIFVYDRELLSATSNGAFKTGLPEAQPPSPLALDDPPDAPGEASNLATWQNLFRDREKWAIDLSKACENMLRGAEQYDAETIVIQRATAIAVENVKQHVGGLHQKYEEAKTWAADALRDQAALLDTWEAWLQKLSYIPAQNELRRFLKDVRQTKINSAIDDEYSLQDFIDRDLLRKAASQSAGVSQRLSRRLSELTTAYDATVQDGSDLVENFNHAFSTSNMDVSETANGLTEEIEAIVKKISSDYESNLSLTDTPKSVNAISKTALLHSRNFLPSLMEAAVETDELLRKTAERRAKIMHSALSYLQRISVIESALAGIQSGLAALDIGADDGEALEAIGFPQQLPYIYGSLLIEIARRREWDDKMKTDSSTLAEEMGIHKEEEEKRRKRWLKTIDSRLNQEALDSRAMGIEVNLKSQERSWPRVTREDIGNFFSCLAALEGFESTLTELREIFKGLDAPTKQQIRRGNAFRNGSVHDAAFGRNSLLLRGDDELLRSLQTDKSKLEDRLKGSESRIRKLEDLLHRQSQISRPLSGNVPAAANGSGLERHATSPVLNHASSSPKSQDNLSRRPSVTSRRFSANLGLEEKALAQRIVKLEAELVSEKARTAQLQAASADHKQLQEELRCQVQEAVSTKKDLMENFEAQQQEFDGERRLFQEENTKLKVKLEELEEEFDRVLGSHDNAKVGIDERARRLDVELDKVKRDAAEEVQKAQGQIDFLKSDYTMQREKANQLGRQVQELEEEKASLDAENSGLRTKLQRNENLLEDNLTALRATHVHLNADEVAPDDFSSLVEAIEILSERSANHLYELKHTLEAMRADGALSDARSKKQEQQVAALGDRLAAEEMEVFSLREEMSRQNAHVKTLETELEDERKELERLRTKFAAGETGSAELRTRVAEEEKKVEELSTKLESAHVHTKGLEAQIDEQSSHIQSAESSRTALLSRLEFRARRAEELSTMLFSHTERLSRLLEHIGFTITKQEDGMLIQRTPRTASGSTMLTDQSQSMNRSMSAPLPAKSEEPPPEITRWARSDDLDTETESFDTFMREIQTFNMDNFTETVIKRVKDTEHTARKWQREAKAYRDKSHRAQLEAHEKIAYRTFKEGDLALFLPTRNQATRPWAAFNVGAPHYFLREQDSHRLRTRDWLLARISKVEERVVDLSQSMTGLRPPSSDRHSLTSDGAASMDDENPFELSDGLRWYMLDAAEEKPGAPSTPGLGKSTVASANVDARGSTSIQRKKASDESRATKTLAQSLDSRRSSSGSKNSLKGVTMSPAKGAAAAIPEGAMPAEASSAQGPPTSSASQAQDQLRTASVSPTKQVLDPDEGGRSRTASPAKPMGSRSPQKGAERPKTRWEGLWSLDLSLESGKGKK
ncbi:oligomeric, coiled-coil, peripheral membrane protein [Trapelia coarctata]|nr:oligomeric, coiled-coil, peripheral membrane protein [Trapelia coarctata]